MISAQTQTKFHALPLGEQLIAVDEVEQRHRFAPQRVDDMAVIDHMGTLAGPRRASPRQGHQQGGADEHLKPVVIEPNPQAMADQPERHRVEDLFERKAARGGHGDERLLMVAGSLSRQKLQSGPLGVDALGVVGVLTISSTKRR